MLSDITKLSGNFLIFSNLPRMKKSRPIFIFSVLVVGAILGGRWLWQEIKKPSEFKMEPVLEKKSEIAAAPENKNMLSPAIQGDNPEIKNISKPAEEPEKKEEKNVVLSGKKTDAGVELSWTVSGVEATNGFKAVRSVGFNPSYPGDDSKNIPDSSVKNYVWETFSGKNYHFRICVFDGKNGCLLYSNDVVVEAPKKVKKKESDYASGVTLKAEKDGDDDVNLVWEISGGKAPEGFKIIRDINENPRYPENAHQTVDDPNKRKYKWQGGHEAGKNYYFRVCVWEKEKCGTYSNSVAVNF